MRQDNDSLFIHAFCLFSPCAGIPLGVLLASFTSRILACCAIHSRCSILVPLPEPALHPLLSTRRQNASLASLTFSLWQKPSFQGSQSLPDNYFDCRALGAEPEELLTWVLWCAELWMSPSPLQSCQPEEQIRIIWTECFKWANNGLTGISDKEFVPVYIQNGLYLSSVVFLLHTQGNFRSQWQISPQIWQHQPETEGMTPDSAWPFASGPKAPGTTSFWGHFQA